MHIHSRRTDRIPDDMIVLCIFVVQLQQQQQKCLKHWQAIRQSQII